MSATTSRPALIHAMTALRRRNAMSAKRTPTQIASEVAGAPRMSAPETIGSASRLSAPYFVSGICCARRKTIVASIATIPHVCVIQRVSSAIAAISSPSPSRPTRRAYHVRKARMLVAVDPAPERRGQRQRRFHALLRRAHDRAADDDAVRQPRHGARLFRTRDTEADAERERGRGADARRRGGQVGWQLAALPRDAQPADEIDEAAPRAGDRAHPLLGRRRRDEPDERQRSVGEPGLALRIRAEREKIGRAHV